MYFAKPPATTKMFILLEQVQQGTDDERRQTLDHLKSIITISSNNHLSFSLSHIHDVCTWNYKDFVFVSSPISSKKELSKRCQSLAGFVDDIHSSVAFPILPIDTENLDYRNIYYIDKIEFYESVFWLWSHMLPCNFGVMKFRARSG